jgi:DNA-binding CsgD family transcriptional regulator
MPSIEAISALIAAIYDCVIAPDKWEATLNVLRAELNFASAVLGANSLPSGETAISVCVGIPPEWQARIPGYGAEIMRSWGGVDRIHSFPLDEPILQSQAMGGSGWQANRWLTEWAYPQGLIDAVSIPFARDSTMVGSLTCGRHSSAGHVTDAEMSMLRLIAPHVRRAVVIGRLLDQQTMAAVSLASAFEAVAAGVMLVDESLGILHTNGVAARMLTAGDPIRSRNGTLELPSALTTDALATAVKLASGSEIDLGRRGIGIPVRHRDGAASVAHVLPLRRKQIRQDLLQRASAAVFVAPAASPPRLPADAVALLYDLTPAEVRIFELVAEGRTQREISGILSIAPSTVKTHLLRVFEKTGCNRQASLVKLAASISSPL